MADKANAGHTFTEEQLDQLTVAVALALKDKFASFWNNITHFIKIWQSNQKSIGLLKTTSPQFLKVLHFSRIAGTSPCSQKTHQMPGQSDTTSNILQGFQALYSEINKTNSNYLLRTANNLYGEQSYEFSKEYLKLIETYYYAKPQAVNFATVAEDARKEINCWVENQTDSKIKNLLPEGSVNCLTASVLVNAVYFKGKWANTFQESNTTESQFRLSRVCDYNSVYHIR
ncbi:serpin B10-like [Microcaecilia unicolor]|uniref:Serpin B10-like n=1 Tax=Microcaecilia unicolor TaxID=1415580 RepID=A0A6P7YVW1_9AMPH|nr:serpin B10-like [Microcaecilia unicolor]